MFIWLPFAQIKRKLELYHQSPFAQVMGSGIWLIFV